MKREFLAIPVVAFMVGYGALVFWVATKGTAPSWIVLVLVSIGLAVLIGIGFARRSRRSTGMFPRAVAPDDGRFRVLVVVDGKVQSTDLGTPLHEAAASRPIKAFAVAPVLSSRVDRLTGDQASYDQASAGLESTLEALEALGADAAGRVGAHDPVQAVADALQDFPADAIVVTTHPRSRSGRLESSVVETVKRRAAVPVTHVVVDE